MASRNWRAEARTHDGVEDPARGAVLEDAAAIGAREGHRPAGDRVEDFAEVQRRADGPDDLAERPRLLQRLREVVGPRLQLLEEAHVLDGDHRLIGKRLKQRDLLVGERAGPPGAGPRWRRWVCPRAASAPRGWFAIPVRSWTARDVRVCPRARRQVVHVNDPALEHGAAGHRPGVERQAGGRADWQPALRSWPRCAAASPSTRQHQRVLARSPVARVLRHGVEDRLQVGR